MRGARALAVQYCVFIVAVSLFPWTSAASQWIASFEPQNTTVHMNTVESIRLSLSGLDTDNLIKNNATVQVVSDADILQVSHSIPLKEIVNGRWSGTFNISAVFLGNANVFVDIVSNGATDRSAQSLSVIIIREERLVDTLFVVSVASLVSILYINFGAALDVNKVKLVLRKPIGPAIAFFCHFFFLPVVSDISNN